MIIFLRFADVRFAAHCVKLEKQAAGSRLFQSAPFVSESKWNRANELLIEGIEKTDETGRVSCMSLAFTF